LAYLTATAPRPQKIKNESGSQAADVSPSSRFIRSTTRPFGNALRASRLLRLAFSPWNNGKFGIRALFV
jgi:hypothetical protein